MSKNDHSVKPFRGAFNTLAQSGTSLANSLPAIVQGKGTDLGNSKAIKGRAKRKLITQSTVLRLIDLSKSENLRELHQSYWNTYHCQNKVYTANGRLYGRYCKNRYCTLCSANRKADIINRYLPVIEKWPNPHFLTLTVKAVPYNKLRPVMSSMIKVFRLIIEKYRKQSIRGAGSRLKGIRSLESNFNPVKRTYNPHFHIIVPDKATAEMLQREWLERSKPGWALKWAQNIKPIKSNIAALIEAVKYGSKIFTETDLRKRSKNAKDHRVYAKALHNIFLAMKGFRIFERFGFNLPKNEKHSIGSRLVKGCKEWQFDITRFDWFNCSGHRLTDYNPANELLHVLRNYIDDISE